MAYAVIVAVVAACCVSAVLALAWSLSSGQLSDLERQSRVIFYDDSDGGADGDDSDGVTIAGTAAEDA